MILVVAAGTTAIPSGPSFRRDSALIRRLSGRVPIPHKDAAPGTPRVVSGGDRTNHKPQALAGWGAGDHYSYDSVPCPFPDKSGDRRQRPPDPVSGGLDQSL
jgi:hypothetical protein